MDNYNNAENQSLGLEVGKEFSSLVELENAIEIYEKTTMSNFTKFSSRTIEGARKKGLKRHINPILEYAALDYRCIRSGEYKTQSTGIRPQQSSFRSNCPVLMTVRPNDSGDKLVIKNFISEHNHICSKAMFDHYPRQRRLDTDAKIMASKLVTMKVNKKILQNDLMKTHNKVITLKDIHNLVTSKSPASDALKVLVQSYEGTDVTLNISKNEKNELKAIFYQDKEMQRIFSLCPEVLFVDAIYKVNDLRMPLYVFLVVDSNGLSEIVGFCLLTSEDKENVSNMALTFKNYNPEWKKIKCIMADKDFTERNVFKEQFPDSQILICIFHCLRSMSREITCEKMKINSGERIMVLEIIQSMVFAKNYTDYDEIHKKLEDTNMETVINYFNKNWHGIKTEWVVYFQSKFMTLGNRTNNRLESINQKITQVVTKFSRLDQLFQGLEMLMITLRTERDHIATECFCKTPSYVGGLSDDIKELFWYLTPFAFNLVHSKIKQMDTVQVMSTDHMTQSGVINSREGVLNVTVTSCTCSFKTSMCLPCHHIFKLRKIHELSLYHPELCADRWISINMKSSNMPLSKQKNWLLWHPKQ